MTSAERWVPDEARLKPGNWSGRVGLMLVLLFSVFRLPPWLPLFVTDSPGVDPSWQMLLNEAVPNDWGFGRNLFFTYGPFGFVHARMYHPETWAILMTVWTGISITMADLVWRVSGHYRLSSFWRPLVGIVVLELMSRDAMAMCFSLHSLVFFDAVQVSNGEPLTHEWKAASDSRQPFARWLRASLPVLLLATLPWSKFSYFVTVLFLGCVLAVAAMLQRKWPWRTILLFSACPFAWTMTGGSLVECRDFIVAGFQLAGGYDVAMGLAPSTSAGVIVIVSAAAVVVLLPVWLSSRMNTGDWRIRVLTILFFQGLFFITWKSCFVRYHPERIPVFTGTVLPILVYGLSGSGRRLEASQLKPQWLSRLSAVLNRRIVSPGLIAALSIVFAAGVVERAQPLTASGVFELVAAPLRDQLLAVKESVLKPDWRQGIHETQLAKIRSTYPIPDIEGTVDVFPSRLIVAFAHGLNLRPRPMLQSYAAFSPALIERDALHFNSPRAPNDVLISVGEIDGRLPMLEDSHAWLQLMSNYELTDSSRELLRLSRVRQPRLTLQTEPALRTTLKFGETLQLPESLSGPVWCRMRIRPSWLGRLVSVLYRLPELRLRVQTTGRRSSIDSYRLIPGAAEAGFLVSPIVRSRADLIRLWQSDDELMPRNVHARVTEITCSTAGGQESDEWPGLLFDSEFTFELFEIRRLDGLSPGAERAGTIASRMQTSY